jgi:hypothetical protein
MSAIPLPRGADTPSGHRHSCPRKKECPLARWPNAPHEEPLRAVDFRGVISHEADPHLHFRRLVPAQAI